MRSKVLIVTDCPEANPESKPFGRSRTILRPIMQDAGFDIDSIPIAYACDHQPKNGKKHTKTELKASRDKLLANIAKHKPKVVVLVGNTPLQAITGAAGIKKLRGAPIKQDGVLYIPIYHPSLVYHDPNMEDIIRIDFKTIQSVIKFGGVPEELELNRKVVNDNKSFKSMMKDLARSKEVSYDIETASDDKDLGGLYPWAQGARIVMLGFSTKRAQWSMPLHHFESNWKTAGVRKKYVRKALRAVKKKKIVTHNGQFDCVYTRVHYGIALYPTFDTQLAHFMLDENDKRGLKYLATKYCNAPNWDVDSTEKQGQTSLRKLSKYHAHDIFYTLKLKGIFLEKLREDPQTYQIFKLLMMPSLRMFCDVEYTGVYVDPDKIQEVKIYLEESIAKCKAILVEFADINWGSNDQVAKYLFEDCGLTSLQKTDGGKDSVAESPLKRIIDEHGCIAPLLELRGHEKQLSTFIVSWLNKLDDYHRIHPQFKLDGTVTGRLSSKKPNLQQVPRDQKIRSLITAAPGYKLVEADLSQVELRFAGEMSGDPELKRSFIEDEDPHWLTIIRECHHTGAYGAEIKETVDAYLLKNNKERKKLKLPKGRLSLEQRIKVMLHMGADVAAEFWYGWKEARKKAKAINFGFLYGMWWKKFIDYARDNYGVKVTPKEAQSSRSSYFELYYGLPSWHKRQINFVRRNGYVRSLIGRKRRLPEALVSATDNKSVMKRKEAERQAINSPVQGMASDYNLMVALEVCEKYRDQEVYLLGTVHDAVLFEVEESLAEEVGQYILKVMRRPKLMDDFELDLDVPIKGDGAIGPWSMGIKIEEAA